MTSPTRPNTTTATAPGTLGDPLAAAVEHPHPASLSDRIALALAIRHALGHQAILRSLRARPMPARRRRRAQRRHLQALGVCHDNLASHVATISRVSGWDRTRVLQALAAQQPDWPIPTATELVVALCPELDQALTPGRQVLVALELVDRQPGADLLTDLAITQPEEDR